MRAGSTLVVHTTTTVQTIGVLAAAAAERGAHVVDAPVSGTADDIRSGRLTVLAGGDEAPVARCTEVFRAYADPILATGALGTATKVKLVNNILFAANVQPLSDAARLAAELGVA
jgi:3-hydroxyisobutyrate dehydrogenase-like beta-hydroxyacid dehydrogenase